MKKNCFKVEVATDNKHFAMFIDLFAKSGTSDTPITALADKVFAVGIKTMWQKLQRRKRK